MKALVLEIPGDVAGAMRLPEGEKSERLHLELAVSLYAQGILGLGMAAQLAHLPRADLNRVLAQRNVPMHYGADELAEDVAHAGSRQ
jgi:predicted HTH domain antitoxin